MHCMFEIGSDLHRLPAIDSTDFFYTGHFFCKTDTARTADAARHHCLDHRTHIFFGDRTLIFLKTRTPPTISYRLVLQITLTALVTNRTIKRMVDKQKLHHSFTGFSNHFRIGTYFLTICSGQRAACLRFWRPGLHFDQTHAAIPRNTQPFMIAETRNFLACKLSSLKHGCALWHFYFDAIYGDFRHYSAASNTSLLPAFSRIRCSISGRKWRIRPWIGHAAASPNAQIVWPSTCLVT